MAGYRLADAAGVVEHEDVVYVATLPGGPIAVLSGVAGLILLEACDGPATTLVERVAELTAVDPEEIRAHVEGFVGDLVERGLLVREVS
ncbi:PqqD family protein [Agromyces kandeliae]|uniref:PqqD family peptide modification chaperone n=1 Tax=Agromyces kandeliae TaxID=2666141 RepID=A0A6L5R153_9MICO|nr:PqqD family protein [Agromyces kandeliae]MRX43689.1 PqqD family peptide modification chaperone [Agromyces kandeliae]